MSSKWLTVGVAVWLSVALLAAEPEPKPKQAPPKQAQPKQPPQNPARQEANKAQVQAASQQARAAQQALNAPNLPGGLTLQRLAQMTSEERATALTNLPPARRQIIEQKVENYLNLPPEQQERVRSQLERMQTLPPDRAADVRQSLREFQVTPQPRKVVIARELAHLGTLTDEQSSVYMSKPGFRGRFSESEIQLMNNLRGIVP
jgi:hypothetical protein